MLKNWWISLDFNNSNSLGLDPKMRAAKAMLISWNKDVVSFIIAREEVILIQVVLWVIKERG